MKTFSRARRRRLVITRVIATVSLSALALVFGAGVAAAHVSVNPSEAAAGDEAVALTFRVPNESATAGTVGITVAIPLDSPFAYLSVMRVPGWTVTPTKTTLPNPVTEGDVTIKEAVTSVTWTADPGTQIGPGEFAEFEISAGPVPDVPAMAFPTTQTYSDGTVVSWSEPTPASGAEPEHPVPTLTIGPAADDATGSGSTEESADSSAPAAAGSAEVAEPSVTAAASTTGTADSGSAATILAVVSIVIAAAALLVAAIALRRRPAGRSNPPKQG